MVRQVPKQQVQKTQAARKTRKGIPNGTKNRIGGNYKTLSKKNHQLAKRKSEQSNTQSIIKTDSSYCEEEIDEENCELQEQIQQTQPEELKSMLQQTFLTNYHILLTEYKQKLWSNKEVELENISMFIKKEYDNQKIFKFQIKQYISESVDVAFLNEIEIIYYFQAIKKFLPSFDFLQMRNDDVRLAFLLLSILVKETMSQLFLNETCKNQQTKEWIPLLFNVVCKVSQELVFIKYYMKHSLVWNFDIHYQAFCNLEYQKPMTNNLISMQLAMPTHQPRLQTRRSSRSSKKFAQQSNKVNTTQEMVHDTITQMTMNEFLQLQKQLQHQSQGCQDDSNGYQGRNNHQQQSSGIVDYNWAVDEVINSVPKYKKRDKEGLDAKKNNSKMSCKQDKSVGLQSDEVKEVFGTNIGLWLQQKSQNQQNQSQQTRQNMPKFDLFQKQENFGQYQNPTINTTIQTTNTLLFPEVQQQQQQCDRQQLKNTTFTTPPITFSPTVMSKFGGKRGHCWSTKGSIGTNQQLSVSLRQPKQSIQTSEKTDVSSITKYLKQPAFQNKCSYQTDDLGLGFIFRSTANSSKQDNSQRSRQASANHKQSTNLSELSQTLDQGRQFLLPDQSRQFDSQQLQSDQQKSIDAVLGDDIMKAFWQEADYNYNSPDAPAVQSLRKSLVKLTKPQEKVLPKKIDGKKKSVSTQLVEWESLLRPNNESVASVLIKNTIGPAKKGLKHMGSINSSNMQIKDFETATQRSNLIFAKHVSFGLDETQYIENYDEVAFFRKASQSTFSQKVKEQIDKRD